MTQGMFRFSIATTQEFRGVDEWFDMFGCGLILRDSYLNFEMGFDPVSVISVGSILTPNNQREEL